MHGFVDFLDPFSKSKLIISQLSSGDVYKMHLGEEEQVKGKNPGDNGRTKFFIVLGKTTDGSIIGFTLINSHINENLTPELKDNFYEIKPSAYSFLDHNSFVDCDQIKEIKADKFCSLFKKDTKQGEINDSDMKLIIEAVKASKVISKKTLKKFGLQ